MTANEEIDESVAETSEEVRTMEARAHTSEVADRQRMEDDIGKLQVKLDALKERVRQRREADVARFREAKEQYDNTMAVFVDKPDAGEIGLN
jgi:hypothetical protein